VAVTLDPSCKKIGASFEDFKFKSLCLALLIIQKYLSFCGEKILGRTILKNGQKNFVNLAIKKNCALTCTPI
jgi:hypothetical protein